ncbi:unnamed protein product [Spirodela intermedia]|uniref:Uncharacterized protein n=1 Tax=Spirodela intermedia TaxID=51605 RepID=A0A7I8LG86_SPIIN|nr:unnamed protein product [Spirodela intermedia]
MCGRQSLLPPLVFFLPLLCNLFFSTAAAAVLKPGEQLRENETLLSAGGSFQLGFFPAGGGSRRYLGIWYANIPERTIVWVANRESPITTFPGALSVSTEGKLSLSGGDGAVIWSSSSGSPGAVAELLETGNLVLKAEAEKDEEKFFWQSFDYPTDTLLPGMKLGWNLKTRLDRYLLSWKGPDDPSPGDFSFRMNIHGSPQMFLMNQTAKLYRSGPWNGVRLSGVPEMKSNDIFTFRFVANSEEVYYTYELVKKELVSRLVVTTYGQLHRFVLLEKRWNNYWHAPKDQCDSYSFCGPYGVCDSNRSPVCSCLAGFKPKSPTDWALRDGTDGCEREIPLECGTGEGFVPMSGMKLPDAWQAVMYKNMSIEECEQACLRNCSCAAYTAADIRDGSGCIMWVGELTDLRHYLEDGQDVYMRTPASLLGEYSLHQTHICSLVENFPLRRSKFTASKKKLSSCPIFIIP